MKSPFKILLVSRVLFFLFALTASLLIPLHDGYLGNQFDLHAPYLAWIWANFDGRHYLNIATIGYQNFDFAFFPLYSVLINFSGKIIPISPLLLGLLISISAFWGSLVVIEKIIKLDRKDKLTLPTLLLISFFPLSFFYQSVYPDSLFLFLSTTSFYFARRKRWVLCGIFGFLTTLTRLSGMALLPALLAEYFLQNRKLLENLREKIVPFSRSVLVALVMTGLGFVIYLTYLQIYHQDFWLFQKSMIAWRQNEFTFPPQVIFRYLKIFFLVDKSLLVYWVSILEFVSMILYFALTFYMAKKARLSYAVFMFFIFLLPTFTGTFAGMPRYALHAFPVFIGLALLIQKNKLLLIALSFVLLILGFIFTGLFTRGYFIS